MGGIAINMIGFKSGHLTVLARTTGPIPKRAYWECLCRCGNRLPVMGKYLRSNEVKSCGCMNRQGIAGPANYRHGHAPSSGVSRTYQSWYSMIQRCENSNSPGYRKYGARGIAVCPQWHDFRVFLADMGVKPKDKRSIDRYPNNEGNYEPGNCRWATDQEQADNKRREKCK